ncbi:MAG: 2-dehydropantoate 2-reductase [Deltaproteobacteria bacterium]|nr:2-dehydropantoate 2-reductase [Deltaproteobacteria bacterium]
MRMAIVGLGGVGGYYGGKLARCYSQSGAHEVIFVARGKTLQAIKAAGLKVKAQDGEFVVRPDLVSDNPQEIGKVDFVLVCTKSYGLEDSLATYRGIFGANTVTVSLLNGVNNDKRIAQVLGGEGFVLDGLVYINAGILEPGVISQNGPVSKLIFGTNSDLSTYRPLEALMKEAGIDAHLVSDITTQVWIKYLFICPLAGITAMRKKSLGEINSSAADRQMLEGMIKEAKAVADKQGVALPDDIVATTLKRVGDYPAAARTSMQKDFEAGNKTELDVFTGYISRAGKELRVPTPLHDEVYQALLNYC